MTKNHPSSKKIKKTKSKEQIKKIVNPAKPLSIDHPSIASKTSKMNLDYKPKIEIANTIQSARYAIIS